MSPWNQITGLRRGWMHERVGSSLCHRAIVPREEKGRVEIVMAFVSQAIKRYWSSLPPGRSNLQRFVRNENGVILRLVHPASARHFVCYRFYRDPQTRIGVITKVTSMKRKKNKEHVWRHISEGSQIMLNSKPTRQKNLMGSACEIVLAPRHVGG